MSYQSTDVALQIDSTDPQVTIDGTVFVLKMRSLMGLVIFEAFEMSPGMPWQGVLNIDENVKVEALADPAAYLASKLPIINNYLKQRFPSTSTTTGATHMDAYQLFAKYLTDHVKFVGTPPQVVVQ